MTNGYDALEERMQKKIERLHSDVARMKTRVREALDLIEARRDDIEAPLIARIGELESALKSANNMVADARVERNKLDAVLADCRAELGLKPDADLHREIVARMNELYDANKKVAELEPDNAHLRASLERLEWIQMTDGVRRCPVCLEKKPLHYQNCWLGKELRGE